MIIPTWQRVYLIKKDTQLLLHTNYNNCVSILFGRRGQYRFNESPPLEYFLCSYNIYIMSKYATFNYPNSQEGDKTLLTGIRQVANSSDVYISGFYEPKSGSTIAFVYKGKLTNPNKGIFHTLSYPNLPDKTVTATNLYGPNNGPNGQIQVVGNYTIAGSNGAIGCLYEGLIDGSGTWTTILPPSSEPVLNVICHSTHGGLVVGNFDTQLDEGKAFIYNIKTKKYFYIMGKNVKSITAYGIWNTGTNKYTICGGYTALNIVSGFSSGYLVDFDLKKEKFSNFRVYSYDNDHIKSVITHFDGITTDNKKGFYLTGDTATFGSDKGSFFCHVPNKKSDKGKDVAIWKAVSYPGAKITSGNTVLDKVVLGVYTAANDSINGYTYSL
jgi:hypothetical protein